MGLFLPVLLLGMAQIADPMPAPSLANPQPQVAELRQTDSRWQAPPINQTQSSVPDQNDTCFTMRSYYFNRHDDLAPEYRGMTTCEPSRAVTPKRTLRRHQPRLVPMK